MYGLGFLAAALLPFLVSAAPAPTDYDYAHCCTITAKADYPDKNPNDYFKVTCDAYQGEHYITEQDQVNRVWRSECHGAVNVPSSLHEVILGAINVDCKNGKDACE